MPDREDEFDESGLGRPFWSGTITFGLVSVPVNLLTATRSDRIPLRMVTQNGRPLKRRYVSPRDDRVLDWDEIVRGYEIEKDQFVVLDDDELERLAPEKTRDIDLRVFVKASDIDPVYFDRPYYLTPAGGSTKAYRLLARVMEDTGRAGIATFVMRAKEYLVAILAENGILRAETLRFVDEIRSAEDVGLPEPREVKTAAVKAMTKEIEKRAADHLDLSELSNQVAERMQKLVKKKMKQGGAVVAKKAESGESRDVIDLVEMLQRSLQGGGAAKQRESAASDDEIEGRSKAELYERAKELDIPGRSGMTKEELAHAVGKSA